MSLLSNSLTRSVFWGYRISQMWLRWICLQIFQSLAWKGLLEHKKTDVCKVFSCTDHLSWSSKSFGISVYQDCWMPCENADSLSSLSSCGNADSLSPLCAHLGVLHPERQDYREEGGGGPGWRVLPHYRDAQQRREGEGGPPSTQRIINEELRTAVSHKRMEKS